LLDAGRGGVSLDVNDRGYDAEGHLAVDVHSPVLTNDLVIVQEGNDVGSDRTLER
jgi:hypothetical protein